MNALRNRLRPILLCVLLLIFASSSFAQLTANFTANNTSGCSPIVVQFTDQSTGNPNQWKWDLGNGVTSSLQNPSATYFTPGTYNVTLVVRNAANTKDSLTKSQFITVYDSPAPDFKASNTVGCTPLNVQFTDLSTAGSGTIASYQWDFGDGGTGTGANPSHVYTTSGNYSVTLRLVNSNGCTKTISKTQYILVGSRPAAQFSEVISGTCSAPVTVSFTNTSTGNSALTYLWSFGDGGTSSAASPSHTYTANGTYSVRLVVTTQEGCSDTLNKPNLVSIGNIKSDFSIPATVCQGQALSITNTSAPAPSASNWSFGDGTFSNSINPTKIFSSAGTYTIKLVNNFGGCKDSTTKSITVVPKPTAFFSVNDTAFCSVPAVVNFTNNSVNGVIYSWNFGDGATSAQNAPSHTYTNEGDYRVVLTVTSANGCIDTSATNIHVHKPQIGIIGLPASGCVPLTIQPVPSIISNQPTTGYLWKFGDGSTSTQVNPTHVYVTAGTYTVKLFITTASGCVDSMVVSNAVRAGNKPVVNFTALPTDVCASTPVRFTDQTPGPTDQWLWTFGDGGKSDDHNPEYQYSDTGWFNVNLIVWSNGCMDSITIKNVVHIKPPIASFSFVRTCSNKYKIDFTDHSIGAETYAWSFGDGATSNLPSPSHTYASKGSYSVTLVVTNGSCTNTKQTTVYIADEKADFTGSTDVCRNSPATYSVNAVNAANITQWQWDFGDGSSDTTSKTATHSFANSGVYTIKLTITDIYGCTDTKTVQTTVNGPAAAFVSDQNAACLNNNTITFTDKSVTDGTHAIAKRVWSYGDGIVDSTSAAPYTHSYSAIGNYTITLKVTDANGCSDQATGSVIISKPTVNFNTADSLSCTGKAVQFNNLSAGNTLSYQWDFGDNTQDIAANPGHTFGAIGVYSVKLVATDMYGCKDSLIQPNYVTISYPRSLFTVSDSIGTCPPLNVIFTNKSTSYTSLQWDFGDGNTSTSANPSHYYTMPGTYYAKLTVTGPGGCTDVMLQKIVLRGPQGTFTYAPTAGCSPLTISFQAHTLDNLSFIWDYSDGSTYATLDSLVSHTYTVAGDYVPRMILKDASGCTVPVQGTDTIHVKTVNASMAMDQFRLCDSGFVQFNSTSISNDNITGYQWNFGDGTSSTLSAPSHKYTASGKYSVDLKVTTQLGCTSSVSLVDTVQVFDSPIVQNIGDTAACIPALINSAATVTRGNGAVLQWKWNFSNGQTSAAQTPPAQTYAAAGSYDISVVAIDNNGCKDSVVRTVYARPLPQTDAGADALVCEGSSIQLNATGALTYVWNASPVLSCTNCANPVATPKDTATLIVTGKNIYGCTSQDAITLNVRHPFKMQVNNGDTICIGSTVRLRASGADTYNWSPSSNVDNPTAANTTARPSVTTNYEVIGKDKDNCFADTAHVFVKVYPIPTVSAGVDQTIVVGTTAQLVTTVSADVSHYQWSPSTGLSCATCPNPVSKPKMDTKYTVQVSNDGGCTAQADVSVFVTCGKGNLYIPNTFSPNGDGKNEVFYPRGVGINRIKSLRVFNRWGEMLFEKTDFAVNDISAGWDGKFKGQVLPADVYIYACEVICENNEILLYKGDLTLLK